MRKTIITSLLLLVMTGAQAQRQAEIEDFYQVVNHASIGVGLGILNGGTIELALPVTRYAAIRAGYNFFPKVAVSSDLDIYYRNGAEQLVVPLPSKIEVEGKPNLSTGHFLIDLYPFKRSAFHFTTGGYFGSDIVTDVYNKDDTKDVLKKIHDFNKLYGYSKGKEIGVELGDYFLEPDENGQVNANIQVKKFRPYLGIGFGRAIPEKHRFACCFDMGVQFWGTPSVYVQDHKLSEQDLDGEGKEVMDILSKITVCPAISFRIVGRVF